MRARNIEGAVIVAGKALESRPAGHPNRPSYLRNYANALIETGSIPNQRESIRLLREALEILPPDHPDISASRHDLAKALQKTALSVSDRDELITLHQEALKLLPSGHPCRLSSLDGMAAALLRSGTLASIQDACPLLREALSLHPPSGDHHLHSLEGALQRVMNTLRNRGSAGFQEAQESISVLRDALDILPAGHPSRTTILESFASFLAETGSRGNVHEAILLQREVLQFRSPHDHQRKSSLSNLACYLAMMYDTTGTLPDLKESITLARESLALSSPYNSNYRHALSNLAMSLQFLPDNRDESLALIQQAIPLWPSAASAPFLTSRVLAHIFFFYHEHTSAVGELQQAASSCERALSLCSPNHCCRLKLVALKSKIDTALSALPPVPMRPPEWLITAMYAMQRKYPNDKFDTVLRKTAASAPEWRIKCLDCPGKAGLSSVIWCRG